MTTDSMSRVDWSRMSAATKARKLGYHPTEAVKRGAIGAGAADAYSSQPMEAGPKADDTPDWVGQVMDAVAVITGVDAADLRSTGISTKRDRQTALARRALARAMRRHMSQEDVVSRLNFDNSAISRMSRHADAQAEAIADQALARVEG